MLTYLCKSVIHNLVVTEAKDFCEGSIVLDADLMEAAELVDGERVTVANVTRGHRMETYAVPGERGSGIVETSGSMSHLAQVGDTICVISFTATDEPRLFQRIDMDLAGKENRV